MKSSRMSVSKKNLYIIFQILLGIQFLLDDPNFQDPAQMEAYVVHRFVCLFYLNRVLYLLQVWDVLRKTSPKLNAKI